MKYKVLWFPQAERRLAKLWMNSRQASQIAAAADWFDLNLAKHPLEVGESRPADLRIAFFRPLGILFHVDQPAYEVLVIKVWEY